MKHIKVDEIQPRLAQILHDKIVAEEKNVEYAKLVAGQAQEYAEKIEKLQKELNEANLLCELQASRISGLEAFKKQYSGKVLVDLLEAFAEIGHEQWMEWSKNVAPDIDHISDKACARLSRWYKLWKPYGELTEADKEQDRIWERKRLDVLRWLLAEGSLRIKRKPSKKMRKQMAEGYRENASQDLALAKEFEGSKETTE